MAAASSGHAEVVSRLLVAGAPWNAFDRQANCAGDYALAGQHQDCVDILLSAGDASCMHSAVHYQPHRSAVKFQLISFCDAKPGLAYFLRSISFCI